MPFKVLATLTARAVQSGSRSVNFIWHGGEPLLLGRDYYRRALMVQQELRPGNVRITNSLQTNGTLLDEQWCDFFIQFGFDVGLSIDGPPDIHNINRKYASGRGSHAAVLHGIRAMKQSGVKFGALLVLNHRLASYGAIPLYDYLVELGLNSWSYLAARPHNDPSNSCTENDYVTQAEYGHFMTETFDYWYDRDDGVQIRELRSLLDVIIGGEARVCTLAGNCLGEYFHVEPDGTLYHCDKYLDDENYRLGNVMQETFQQIRESPKMRRLVQGERDAHQVLAECTGYETCKGGCPHDRYIANRYSPQQAACCGQSELIAHIKQKVAGYTALPDKVGLELT